MAINISGGVSIKSIAVAASSSSIGMAKHRGMAAYQQRPRISGKRESVCSEYHRNRRIDSRNHNENGGVSSWHQRQRRTLWREHQHQRSGIMCIGSMAYQRIERGSNNQRHHISVWA